MNRKNDWKKESRNPGMLLILLFLCLLVFSCLPVSAMADSVWQTVIQEDQTVAITGYAGDSSGDIQVPDIVDGHAVTAIESGAFLNLSNGTQITIPMRVTRIADDAFPDNVTIVAYNGSEALDYARRTGTDYQNLSSLDFQDEVVDLSDLELTAKGNKLIMSEADAMALEEGDTVYLANKEGTLEAHTYTVEDIAYSGEEANVSLQKRNGLDQVKSYHVSIHNQPLTDAKFSPASRNVIIDNLEEGPTCSKKIEMNCTLAGIQTKLTLTYSATIDASYDYDEGGLVAPSGEFILNETITIQGKSSLDYVSAEKLEAAIRNNTGTPGSEDVPIANFVVPVGTTGVMISGSIGVKVTALLAGEIDYTIVRRRGYIWTGGIKQEINEPGEVDDSKSVLKAMGSLSISVTGSIGMDFAFLADVAKFEASAGLTLTLKADSDQQYDKNITCSDLTVSADFKMKASISLTVGVNVNAGILKSKLKWEIQKVELTLLDENIFLAGLHIEFHHDRQGLTRWMFLKQCSVPQELKRTFHLCSGTKEDLDDIKVLVGNQIQKPEAPEIENARIHFLGWYTEPKGGEDFFGDQSYVTVTESMERETTLYARYTEPFQKITIKLNDGTDKTIERFQARGTELEKVYPPLRMNYRFRGFSYRPGNGETRIWSFEDDIVPPNDLVLTGQWEYDETYNPFEEEVNAVLEDPDRWADMQEDLQFYASLSTGMNALVSHSNWGPLTTVAFCKGYEGHDSVVIIPEEVGMLPVVYVDGKDFANKENLTMLVLPSTVQYVTGFNDCPNLQVVIMKDNNLSYQGTGGFVLQFDGVVTIEQYCFQRCPALTNVQFPRKGSLNKIGREAFDNTGLYEVNLPEGVASLERQCFGNCLNLQSVTLPNSITALPKFTFMNCPNLTKMEGLDHVTRLEWGALEATGFRHLKLENISFVGRYNFDGYPNLVTLEVHLAEGGRAEAGFEILNDPKLEDVLLDGFSSTFTNCGALRVVDMTGEDNEYGLDFQWKESLPSFETLILRGTWKSVVLNNLPELRSIYIERLVQYENIFGNIPDIHLYDLPRLSSLVIDDYGDGVPKNSGVTGMGSVRYTMRNVGLETLDLPNLRPKIGYSEFHNMKRLRSLVIPEPWEEIGRDMFSNNPALETVILPRTLKTIGMNAFQNDSALKEIELPEGIETIAKGAFGGTGITSVVLPAGVTDYSGIGGIDNLILAEGWESITLDKYDFKSSASRLTLLGDTELEFGRYFPPEDLFVIVCARNSKAWQKMYDDNRFLTLDINSAEANKVAVRFVVESGGGMLPDDEHIVKTSGGSETQNRAFGLYNRGEVICPPVVYKSNGESVAVEWRNKYVDDNLLTAYTDKTLTCRVTAQGTLNVTYEVTEAGIIITGCTDEDLSELFIPETIFGKPVVGIADYALKGNIRKVILPRTITDISPLSFRRCTGLSQVNISNGEFVSVYNAVYALDEQHRPEKLIYCPRGFEGALTIPEGVTEIADDAVFGCPGLESVVLPQSLTTIGENNFCCCPGLKEIVLPSALEAIGEGSLTRCDELLTVAFAADCEPASTVGLGCHKDLRFFGPMDAEQLINWADQNYKPYNLYDITFVDGDESEEISLRAGTSLEDYALSDQAEKSFQGWALAEGETPIIVSPANEATLYACWQQKLLLQDGTLTGTNLEAGDELVVPYGVEEIAENAVTVPLTAAYIPSTVSSIADNAFVSVGLITGDAESEAEQFAAEKDIPFQEAVYSLEFISGEGTACESIQATANTIIDLPVPTRNRADFDGWYEDRDCRVSYSGTIMPGHDMVLYAGWAEKWEMSFLTSENEDGTLRITGYTGSDYALTIPSGIDGKAVTVIGASAFAMKEGLSEVTVPASIQKIETGAFYRSGVSSLIFDGTDVEFSQSALAGMRSLTTLCLPSELKRVPRNLLDGCKNLTDIVLPDTIEEIGAYALNGCTFLKSITLPASLISFDPAMLGNARIREIRLSETNNRYLTVDSCLLTGDGHTLLYVCPREFGTELQIPAGVTRIAAKACSGLDVLSSVLFPDTLTEIDDYAFADCPYLQTIVIPTTVTDLGEHIFGDSDLTVYTSSRENAAYSLSTEYHVVITDGQITEVTGIDLNPEEFSMLKIGTSLRLTATVSPADASDQAVIWYTTDETIASVDQNGIVTGVSQGTATIRAASRNGISASCEVSVSSAELSLSINSKNMSYMTQAADGNKCLFFNTDYSFGSYDYRITVTSESNLVSIYPEPATNKQFRITDDSGSLDGEPVTIHVHGEAVDDSGTFFDRDEVIYACKSMRKSSSFYSPVCFVGRQDANLYYNDCFICREGGFGVRFSNPEVMELRENDELRALKPGTTYIMYKDDRNSWSTFVRVKEMECELEVSAAKTMLFDGETAQLQVTCSDPQCTLQFSPSYGIISVSETGLMTCSNPYGNDTSVLVSVTAMKNGEPVARESIGIQTGKPVTSIPLTSVYRDCYDYSTQTYTVMVRDRRNLLMYSQGRAESVSFISSDPTVLSVTPEGIATALSSGRVVLQYRLYNGTTGEITLQIQGEELKTLVLPSFLRTIEDESFRGDILIQRIVLDEQIEQIGAHAFADCSELREVEIQNGDCDVDETAFVNCSTRIVFYCPVGSHLEEILQSYGWNVNP